MKQQSNDGLFKSVQKWRDGEMKGLAVFERTRWRHEEIGMEKQIKGWTKGGLMKRYKDGVMSDVM